MNRRAVKLTVSEDGKLTITQKRDPSFVIDAKEEDIEKFLNVWNKLIDTAEADDDGNVESVCG